METQNGTALASTASTALTISLPPAIQREIESVTRIAKMSDEQAAVVLECFSADFAPFLAVKAQAEAIVITDASQKDLMQEARTLDRELLEVDKKLTEIHKAKKEEYLRPSQLIDGIRRTYSNAIGDVRAHLKAQFDFVKNQEAEALRKLVAERVARLSGLDTVIIESEIARMTDEQFDLMVDGAKARLAERLEAERLEAEEKERLRAENERLRAENEAREREAAEQRRLAEFERQERERIESEARRKEAEAQQARIDAELAETRRIAAEKQAVIDAEIAETKRIADEKAAEEAAARAKAAAPDRDKLLRFAAEIRSALFNHMPSVSNPAADAVLTVFNNAMTFALDCFERDADSLSSSDCPF